MTIFEDSGVSYFSTRLDRWVSAERGEDIPQIDYDLMAPWERYLVLAHFADQGDDVVRYEE